MPRNMKTVVITSQKGGSGKTTLAAHFAIAVERAGNGPAVVPPARGPKTCQA